MTCRKLVAVTSFVLPATGAAFAPTSAADKARTEDLIKQALDRYNEGIQAAQVQSAQGPSGSSAVVGAGTWAAWMPSLYRSSACLMRSSVRALSAADVWANAAPAASNTNEVTATSFLQVITMRSPWIE